MLRILFLTVVFQLFIPFYVLSQELGLQLDISPEKPVLGEPFYVKATITNTGKTEINVPKSFVLYPFLSTRGGFVLDILSKSLKSVGYSRAPSRVSGIDSGYIIAPDKWRDPVMSFIEPGKKRVMLLGRFTVYQLDYEDNTVWEEFLKEEDAQLRLSIFTNDRENIISINRPISFKPFPSVFLSLKEEENQILLDAKKRLGIEKNDIDFDSEWGQYINSKNRWCCILLPPHEIDLFEKKYPPGTSRALLRIRILPKKIKESNYQENHFQEYIRFLWTLPEIERQYRVFSIFCIRTSAEFHLKMFERHLEDLLCMYPENYANNPDSEFERNDLYDIYRLYANDKDELDEEELRAHVDAILRRPIPPYAGIGNEARGFFLPLREWSVSDEKVKLMSVYEEKAIFETETKNEIIIPLKKLEESEQKYIRELIEIPQTGKMPTEPFKDGP